MINSLALDLHIYGKFIFIKGENATWWGKYSLFKKNAAAGLKELFTHPCSQHYSKLPKGE